MSQQSTTISTTNSNNSSAESVNDAAAQVAELTAKLQEKDGLVGVLTQRLEAAAEQLDRIHRSGGDRRRQQAGGGGGSLPPELVQRQQGLADRLEEAVENWEESQPVSMLERMDRRLEALVDLVRSGTPVGTTTTTPQPEAPKKKPEAAPASEDSPASNWEAMKAQLMGEAAPAPVQEQPDPTEEVQSQPRIPEEEFPPTPSPEVVDLETAEIEELREAIRRRDEYIASLVSEFRRLNSCAPIDRELLQENAPEDLRETFTELERRLRNELQREELAISLERAKLARERGQLDQIRGKLEKEIRRLGMAAPEQKEAEPVEETSNGGWRSMFGGKKKS